MKKSAHWVGQDSVNMREKHVEACIGAPCFALETIHEVAESEVEFSTSSKREFILRSDGAFPSEIGVKNQR